MLKKIALIIMLVIPMGMVAQNLKFGHVYSQEIIVLMPEYTKAMADLQALDKQYQDELNTMTQEWNRKVQEFQQAASAEGGLPANIQERRQKEIQDMGERAEQFQQDAYQQMQKKSQEMMAPISKKVEDAIKAVGESESMIYIFDPSRTAIPFINNALSTDVTPLVKAKLGIK